MPTNLSDLLVRNLQAGGVPASTQLNEVASSLVERSLDPGQSIDDIIASARRAGVSAAALDRVTQQVMTGTEDFQATSMNTRGRLAKVLSRLLEGLEAPTSTGAPTPPTTSGTIGLDPGLRFEDLGAQDKKYVSAFEKAGIRATLTGERDTIDAAAMRGMLDVASKTPGLNLREFLVQVIPDSPHLGFFGVTTSAQDNAAAILLTAADKQRSAAEAAGQDVDAGKLEQLAKALTDKQFRSKTEIATIFKGMDAIYAQDPTAAAPDLRRILQSDQIGRTLRGRYDFHLNYDASRLTVDPYVQAPQTRAATRGAVVSQLSALGGRELMLVDDKFAQGKWEQHSLAELAGNNPRFMETINQHRFDVNTPRDVLVVQGKDDPHPIYLVFSQAGDGVLTICQDCAFHEFAAGAGGAGGGGGPIMVRKPVIYLYPAQTQRVKVDLRVAGELLVHYPKMNSASGWEIMAGPNGELFDPVREKRYSYLFWEAVRSTPFALDLSSAYKVERDEVEAFLEKVADAHALNEKERTDFVSYWIAPLRANRCSVVQLVSEAEYGKYAHLEVTPKPDTVIRLFMIFRRASGEEQVGNPPLPKLSRRGFVVLEWGGSNLDEQAEEQR